MDKKISISQIKEVVQQAYEQVKGNTGGKNADYIPYLANIDKNLFGVLSVCFYQRQCKYEAASLGISLIYDEATS